LTLTHTAVTSNTPDEEPCLLLFEIELAVESTALMRIPQAAVLYFKGDLGVGFGS